MAKSILFYFNSLKPSGGIERVIVTIANKLCSQYEVTIVVKDEPVSFYTLDKRIKLLSLGNKIQFNMKSQLSRIFTAVDSLIISQRLLKKYLKCKSFDYYYLAHPLNVLEFHLARGIEKIDTIISEHGAPNAYNIIYRKIKIWLYPKSKVYMIPTKSDTEYYKSQNLPVQYLPHFKSDLNYEISSLNQNIALSIGRFTEVKQHLVLFKVWKRLVDSRQIKNWKLLLVGEGELETQYREYIKQNNLQNHILLLPPKKDVAYYYRQASLFLLTSKTEGFGMVLLEAISFGLPCISFDCPSGPRDIINNNENGYLIALNDEFEFEKSIISFINNSELKYEMSKKSIELSSNWDDKKLLKQWDEILK